MNPLQLIQSFMIRGMTLEGIVKSMSGDNPILANLIKMADKGDKQGVEQFARNYLKELGFDYDKEMANMKRILNVQ